MLKGIKIKLNPTKEQELLFWKSAGISRWAYNYHLGRNKENYENGGKYLKDNVTRKEITQLKKTDEYKWLNEVGSNVIKQAVKDCNTAFAKFFSKESKFPRFKSKYKTKPSFYVNYERLSKTKNGFKGEKLGEVKTWTPLPDLPEGQKYYSNPHISFDGHNWFLSIGIEYQEKQIETTSTVIGIDLGIKELAVCSDGYTYKNINKTKEVKRLKKKLKREQRKLSKIIEDKIIDYKVAGKKRYPIFVRPLRECKNYIKQVKKVNLIYKRLTNIRTNYLHQTTRAIVNRYPKAIVLENLKVQNMMKNHHLARAIAEQSFYEFRRQIEYKARLLGIDVAFVRTMYPSSKTCSCCGHIKKDLTLKDRTYVCSKCGLEIDRDYNASLNLADCYINQHDLIKK